MLTKKEFIAYLEETVQGSLGENFKVEHMGLSKINQTGDGLYITLKENNIGIVFHIASLYNTYLYGKEREKIAENILHAVQEKLVEAQSAELQMASIDFSQYDRCKEQIYPVLINREKNQKLLEKAPHDLYMDLAVTYRIVAENCSALVSNSLLQRWGITKESLVAQAQDNYRKQKYEITNIEEMIHSPVVLMNVFVVTNDNMEYGAVVMADQNFLNGLQKQIGDYYILPSSIHEVIIIPDNEEVNPINLQQLVKAVNRSNWGNEDERLSDHIYKYKQNTLYMLNKGKIVTPDYTKKIEPECKLKL